MPQMLWCRCLVLNYLGGACAVAGEACLSKGHAVSAREAFLRATQYFRYLGAGARHAMWQQPHTVAAARTCMSSAAAHVTLLVLEALFNNPRRSAEFFHRLDLNSERVQQTSADMQASGGAMAGLQLGLGFGALGLDVECQDPLLPISSAQLTAAPVRIHIHLAPCTRPSLTMQGWLHSSQQYRKCPAVS